MTEQAEAEPTPKDHPVASGAPVKTPVQAIKKKKYAPALWKAILSRWAKLRPYVEVLTQPQPVTGYQPPAECRPSLHRRSR